VERLRRMAPLLAILVATAWAGSPPPAKKPAPGHARQAPVVSQPMRPDEPMTTGMMRKGSMKGDVRKAARSKEATMAPRMEQEEKSMPADGH